MPPPQGQIVKSEGILDQFVSQVLLLLILEGKRAGTVQAEPGGMT
ncbi:hypothetical protein PHLH7_57200 [Pseudomonas sp. Ost2]|nr:hypothetical protein PHLH7_57200 [Pseudomonas sp. Ost2]